MFCPRCGTQNSDEGKFCRSCGSDLAIISKAMTGEIVEAGEDRHRRRKRFRNREDCVRNGVRQAFLGGGLLITALILLISRQSWGVWLVIGGFVLLGKGVADLLAAKATFTGSRLPEPARTTGQIRPATSSPDALTAPPSVTEGTTRMMEAREEPEAR